ncbi:hypothetical protein K438DRAFT_1804941 [Mycena galopus ATCC 62051]|nr:hypothetical protein K438DRAFT_1804941 [Mycena galopus ATCC 62051]
MDVEKLLLRQASGLEHRPLSIRILDLGNAYIVNESSSPKCITPMSYMPPEVAFPWLALGDENAPWDQRSDIWALAVCVRALHFVAYLFQSSTHFLP